MEFRATFPPLLEGDFTLPRSCNAWRVLLVAAEDASPGFQAARTRIWAKAELDVTWRKPVHCPGYNDRLALWRDPAAAARSVLGDRWSIGISQLRSRSRLAPLSA